MIFLILLTIVADPSISIEIKSGTVITRSGEEIEIKNGTFVPSPYDKKLAKEIVSKNIKIRELEKRLAIQKKKTKETKKYLFELEDEYHKEIHERDIRIAALTGWWNSWGKIVLPCAITAVATSYLTYKAVEDW